MDSEVARRRAEGILAAWNRRDYAAVADNVSAHVVFVDHIRGRKAEGPAGYVDRFQGRLEAVDIAGRPFRLAAAYVVHEHDMGADVVGDRGIVSPVPRGENAFRPTPCDFTVHRYSSMDETTNANPPLIT